MSLGSNLTGIAEDFATESFNGRWINQVDNETFKMLDGPLPARVFNFANDAVALTAEQTSEQSV